MTPEQVIEAHLEWRRTSREHSQHTIRQYQAHLHRLLAWCRQHGVDFLHPGHDALAAFTGPYLHTEGLGTQGRRQVLSAIRRFYRWAQSRGLGTDDARLLDHPKPTRRLPVAMSLDAAQRLMWAPDMHTFMGVRDSAILSVLIGCGLRVGSLVHLNEEDLLFEADQESGHERLTVQVRGDKGGSERLVPAPDETRLMLRAYLGHPELEAIDRGLPSGQTVLFVSTMNRLVAAHEYHGEARRLSEGAVREMLNRYAEEAGVPRAMSHPHAFRHLYGTELAEADVDLLVRQELMGHRDPKSTKVYTALAMRKLREASEQGNPMQRIRTPVSDLLSRMNK